MTIEKNPATGKSIINVTVCPHVKGGYLATCVEMGSCWSTGDTIDACIANFRKEYSGLLKITFAGVGLEFKFAVQLDV